MVTLIRRNRKKKGYDGCADYDKGTHVCHGRYFGDRCFKFDGCAWFSTFGRLRPYRLLPQPKLKIGFLCKACMQRGRRNFWTLGYHQMPL